MRRVAVSAVLTATLLFPTLGIAGKPDKGKRRKDKDRDREDAAEVRVAVSFAAHEREAATGYFVETRGRGKCPPGLAKRHNGCLPPGQAKKRYVVGHRLPERIVVEEIPRELLVRIGPPPRGYRYAIVDGDLVKLAVGTLLVVDAIEGLVN
jgi:Ni/Co efflux regulator RcnB